MCGRQVHGVAVRGVDVGPETRCAHYASDADVIAIRFRCCDTYYPCFECHAAVADHEAERWPLVDGDTPGPVVLCGVCGRRLHWRAYLDCEFACPTCGAAFNPSCRVHHDRYVAP